MKLKNALKEFERYIKRAGDEHVPRTPLDATNRMLSFYKDVRARSVTHGLVNSSRSSHTDWAGDDVDR